MTNFNKSSVGIIGGCGHVGLPLGLALTSKGCRVTLIDVNENTVESVNSGVPPFREEGAEELPLQYGGKSIVATTSAASVGEMDCCNGMPMIGVGCHNPKFLLQSSVQTELPHVLGHCILTNLVAHLF